MAAACLNVISIEQIHDRISISFQLLIRGRQNSSLPHHQTLRACLDWSYALLNEAEARTLQIFSVFAGGCNLESLEAVCCEEAGFAQGILEPLSGLVDQSLVYTRLGATGERRYHLLETVRQYAEGSTARTGNNPGELPPGPEKGGSLE
jgi:predicted ATPase